MDVRTVSPPSTGWKYKIVDAVVPLKIIDLFVGTVHHHAFAMSSYEGHSGDAANDKIINITAGHGLIEDKKIKFQNWAGGGGGMPTPLVIGVVYYVKNPEATKIQVAAAPGGAAINITSAGDAQTSIECGTDFRLPEGKKGDYVGIKDFKGHATIYTPALMHCPASGGASQWINVFGTSEIELGIDWDFWAFYCEEPGRWVQMRVNT